MSEIRTTAAATILDAGEIRVSVSLSQEVRWMVGSAEHRIRARICVEQASGRVLQEVLFDFAPGRALPELVGELVELILQVLALVATPAVAAVVGRGGRPTVAGQCVVRALAWAAVGSLQLEQPRVEQPVEQLPAERWREALEVGSGLQPRRDSRGC